jgi:hypothetical protein
MDAFFKYGPLTSPIAMETEKRKRLNWQYKASPVLNTIRRGYFLHPVSLQILFYVSPVKLSAMS